MCSIKLSILETNIISVDRNIGVTLENFNGITQKGVMFMAKVLPPNTFNNGGFPLKFHFTDTSARQINFF